jgi:hypothetical protein
VGIARLRRRLRRSPSASAEMPPSFQHHVLICPLGVPLLRRQEPPIRGVGHLDGRVLQRHEPRLVGVRPGAGMLTSSSLPLGCRCRCPSCCRCPKCCRCRMPLSSPNPAALRLIVMLCALATGRNDRIRPHGRKIQAILPPPPQRKIVDLPS